MKGSELGKDPAVSWFFNDWQGGTMTLSRFQKGCYMDLLTAQFNNGHLSLDEIKTVLGSDFGSSWSALQKKFKSDANGLLYNERLELEVKKRKNYSAGRKKNLENTENFSPHMGKGNGIGNGNENEKGVEVGKVFTDFELTFENFRKQYPGTKRGFETEFKNFARHTSWKIDLNELLPALNKQIEWREKAKQAQNFVPEWANLQTWINQRRWEQELPKIENKSENVEYKIGVALPRA